MTKIGRDLVLDGLIEEAGSLGNTGGKPRTMLRLRADAGYAVGVSVDLNTTRFVLLNFAGHVIKSLPPQRSVRTVSRLSHRIAAGVANIARATDIPLAKINGIGIAGQGPRDRTAPERVPPPYAVQWLDVGVGQAVTELLSVPVMIQNDAHAVAAGEYSLSADARRSGNYACVFLGESGLGSGIVVDGQLVLGSNSYAGAIAHLSVEVNGPECFCGSRGCLELYSTPRAIIEQVRRHDAQCPGGAVGVSTSGAPKPADLDLLYSAARDGNTYAVEQVSRSAEYLAAAAATTAGLLDLDLIIFAGSGFTGMETAYLQAVQELSDRLKRVGARPDFAVRLSCLGAGNEAAAIGAALGVLERHPVARSLRGRSATAERASQTPTH